MRCCLGAAERQALHATRGPRSAKRRRRVSGADSANSHEIPDAALGCRPTPSSRACHQRRRRGGVLWARRVISSKVKNFRGSAFCRRGRAVVWHFWKIVVTSRGPTSIGSGTDRTRSSAPCGGSVSRGSPERLDSKVISYNTIIPSPRELGRLAQATSRTCPARPCTTAWSCASRASGCGAASRRSAPSCARRPSSLGEGIICCKKIETLLSSLSGDPSSLGTDPPHGAEERVWSVPLPVALGPRLATAMF